MTGSPGHGDGMTNSSATSAPTATTALDADDPRAVLARAIATAGAVIDAVQPDQRALPTLCSDYDVRGMVAHLVSVLHRVTVIGRGGDIFTVSDRAELVADDGWLGQWNATADEVQEAWSDPARLEATVQVPWTTMSGTNALAVYTNEITVHTWDLAVATGQHPDVGRLGPRRLAAVDPRGAARRGAGRPVGRGLRPDAPRRPVRSALRRCRGRAGRRARDRPAGGVERPSPLNGQAEAGTSPGGGRPRHAAALVEGVIASRGS